MPGESSVDFTFKVVLLGDINVGKTSIFQRYRDGTFQDYRRTTTGIDSCTKIKQFENTKIAAVLWDTAGTEKFRTVTQNYYRNSNACLLVYSIDEPDSLACLGQWVNDANTYSESAIKILVGNKTDKRNLVDHRKVEEFATHHNCDLIFQVSAKRGEGIDEMFTTLAHKLLEREMRKRQSVSLFENEAYDILTPKLTDKIKLNESCCT
uniref:Uncharacterized protein n=1 Tax=Strigamia maritima TaxID=126957 RepID=T1IQ54_STRMM